MVRRHGTGKFLSKEKISEDVNPMEGIANLSDAMLVLAVGILMALIMHWNINIDSTEVNQKKEISNINQNVAESVENGSGMTEMGTVYKDPKTGKLYMIVKK